MSNMNNVLLVTLQGDNLGNRLQNYALQEVLKENGCVVYTPVYRLKEFSTCELRVKFWIKSLLGAVGIKRYYASYFRHQRIRKFAKFNNKYIDNRIMVDYHKMSSFDTSRFDLAITGSDQVWHGWDNNEDELKYFYLDFVEELKRASYAPSFGFETFPDEYTEIHENGLKHMRFLSARENRGVELISNLVGRNAQCVLDPTLLITQLEWGKIEKRPQWLKTDKFILYYFLGTNAYIEKIQDFATNEDLEVVDAYKKMASPDEFVWLIRNAKYVCTDSFHATAFSIMFNKKFLAFKRRQLSMESMFDRIENLLEICGLEDRIYENDMNSIKIEYTAKDITVIRDKSIGYIKMLVEYMME